MLWRKTTWLDTDPHTTYRLDVTRPDLQLNPAWTPSTWYSTSVTLNATASDAHSGVQSIPSSTGALTGGPSASQIISRAQPASTR